MGKASPAKSIKTFDVGTALEEGPWTAWQKMVVGLVAVAIILDGFDNQVLGFAVPVLLREWGVTREAFAPVFAIGFVGMVIGTALGGSLGDAVGRRPALIASVVIFGAATGCTAFANNILTLGICRAVAGFGLGGAMPIAATLLSEFSPRRKRTMAVTLGIVCIPLGGVGGGLIAAAMLPSFGWRSLFILGGAMPLAVAFLLLMALPESPRFLAMRPSRRDDLVKVMARMGFTVGERDEIADGSIQETGCGTTSALFASDYIRDTAMLWLAFFACLLTTYAVYSWAPTLLSQNGFDISMASLGVAIFNIGGVAGALFAASLTPRLGSRKVLLSAAIGGLVIAMVLALSMSRGGISLLFVLLAIEGAFINAVQTCLYALAAQMYPTHLRATGVGYAAGFGRTGAIVSSFVGAAILAGGWSFYFFTLATGMAITFLALSLIQRHIKAESNNDLQARQGR